jgi:hypothetical protein
MENAGYLYKTMQNQRQRFYFMNFWKSYAIKNLITESTIGNNSYRINPFDYLSYPTVQGKNGNSISIHEGQA